MADTAATLSNLKQARDICLKDAKVYSQVVPGVLNVIGLKAPLELRRWGSDFLAETFASPVLNAEDKQKLCLGVLDTVRAYLERQKDVGQEEDRSVVKAAVQCAASIYPLVFRHIVTNKSDEATWSKMTAIKLSILQRMDTASPGVRICCIKFVARVVQVQTPGVIADPRRPEQNEVSLALVSRDHQIIPPSNLEAEASGLLDRLLGVLQDNDTDALVVTATLNSLSSLVHRRASISGKIMSTVLMFDPLALARVQPVKIKEKILLRSMARTTMSFLINVLKRNPHQQLAERLQRRTEQIRQGLIEVFAESGAAKRKSDPEAPTDGFNDAKRRRIGQQTSNGTTAKKGPPYPPLPPGPGPTTYAQLFNLHDNPQAAGFDVTAIPPNVVPQLLTSLLQTVDPHQLQDACDEVRKRFEQIIARAPPPPTNATMQGAFDDDEEDYDPSVTIMSNQQHLKNQNLVKDQFANMPVNGGFDEVADAIFELPPGPPLTQADRDDYGQGKLELVFDRLFSLDEERAKLGGKASTCSSWLFRVHASNREGWLTIIIRIATRGMLPLRFLEHDRNLKDQHGDNTSSEGAMEAKDANTKASQYRYQIKQDIREQLLQYVMDDWKARFVDIIRWMIEELFAEGQKLHFMNSHLPQREPWAIENSDYIIELAYLVDDPEDLPNYRDWSLKILDQLVIYLDAKDLKYLIRFLSEIGPLWKVHFDRVQKIAEDPERVGLVTNALKYLIKFKAPAKERAIDCAEAIWRTIPEAKASIAKGILAEHRPEALQEVEMGGTKEDLKKEEAAST